MSVALDVVSIVGPTASGKTALALELASRFDAEIVSLDAYQIYRGMDIGTAKPTPDQLQSVRHHLVDIVDIDYAASIADFQQWAHTAVLDINARGKLAICVGGSGLYVRAVLDQLDIPQTDPEIRAKYNQLLEAHGADWLHELLAQRDPTAASLILPGNSRRLVRALEVIEITGKPYNAQMPDGAAMFNDVRIGIASDRETIAQRIRQRTEAMWSAGWPSEVEALVARGLRETPTASRALGYEDVHRYNAGDSDALQTTDLIAAATVKFSKRQMQWFSRDRRVAWLDGADRHLADSATSLVAAAMNN